MIEIQQGTIDITPTPRILRTLGEIPFATWQCLAELVDNSIDAFADLEKRGETVDGPKVQIYWSTENVPAKEREIVVEDNGLGMPLNVLQNAAKAGYSSNDPIHNLGLFGMGFNIATARLGDETLFVSARPEDTHWTGIQIMFDQLIKNQSFSAPIVKILKKDKNESGTRVIVKRLRENVFSDLKRRESNVRRQLESIYFPTLGKGKIKILIQGKQLTPKPYCIWSESRYIVRRGEKIYAIQEIDRDLGETYFDLQRNSYLNDDDSSELDIALSNGKELPQNIVKRSRRLKGWLGIQRYSDTAEFGIDFVRNGRKILIKDKSLFSYENPETGTFNIEYPLELGSTLGGRIVGELNVDYLIPTYQKNSFNTNDRSWRLTLEAIRGAGPILPKQRELLMYDGANDSPLGKLVNGYRRPDPGTKNLAISNSISKEFFKRFSSGDLEFQSDEKWYKAAQEADRDKSEGGVSLTPINPGENPSDDIDSYLVDTNGELQKVPTITVPPTITSKIDELITISEKEVSLTGEFSYSNSPGFDVTTRRLKSGEFIKIDGKRVPFLLSQTGVKIDFFYDPYHSLVTEYPFSIKQLLLFALAEKFALRDKVSTQNAFVGLVESHLTNERINYQSLVERAHSIISGLKEKLPTILGHRFEAVKKVIQEDPKEEENLAKNLFDVSHIFEAYQASSEIAFQSLSYVTDSLVKRFILKFPEEFMDKKVFSLPYTTIKIGPEDVQERLKANSLELVLLYFSDVLALVNPAKAQSQTKQELLRYSNTLSILEGMLV